jgi:hypothetical protein
MPDGGDVVTDHLETLILARLSTCTETLTAAAIARASQQYAPISVEPARWRELLDTGVRGLAEHGIIDDKRRVVRADELKRRTGAHAGTRWQQWSERILPALALGIRADDARAHDRLRGRDAWAAAIVARAHHVWTEGQPPTIARLCDALTWRAIGLGTAPKQCPPEVRAHFLRTYIEVDPGPPERLVRLLASQAIQAPRADLRALYVALIRAWLAGRDLSKPATPTAPSLIEAVRSTALVARDGVFGDRKVFISTVWNALRTTPPWTTLALDDFKARLVSAHRRQELELARADLVAAMDPALVASSETRTDGATFHFIVREPLQ